MAQGLTRRDILAGRCCAAPEVPLSPEAADTARVFRALGDETRLRIARLLAEQPAALCACYIEAAFTLSQPTISHHLKVLRDAELVTAERRGVWMYYRLNRARLAPLRDFLDAVRPADGQEGMTMPELRSESTSKSIDLREAVRERYAKAALRVLQPGGAASCCGGPAAEPAAAACCGGSCGCGAADPISGNLYDPSELAAVPNEAAAASLGCGNPTALAELRPGESVLDLGSGGGIDVLLSARRVGPAGKAYGLDMTDEMLALARKNATAAGATNVEFLRGQIESIPLPEASVDVVISNCVINLSTDKARVLREAFRVLKPGGRFAVSDVVVDGPVPDELRRQVELWVGCVAGALDREDYLRLLAEAGFVGASIEPTRYYLAEELGDAALDSWLAAQSPEERSRLGHAFQSTFIRARKPE